MDLTTLLRTPALVAGPAAVLAVATLVVAFLTTGTELLETSPWATAASALLLVALLGVAAAGLSVLDRLRSAGLGVGGPALALVGTVLVAGGAWATLFVLPTLAEVAPEVLRSQLGGVVVGFIASYVLFTAGWVWTGVALVRSRLVPTSLGVSVAVAGALSIVPSPEPLRLLLISVAASVLVWRLGAPAVVPRPVRQSA